MALASELVNGGFSPGQARAIGGQINSGVSAAGTVITDATDLTAGHNIVTTVAASSGVQLPSANIGDEVFVYNGTATNSLKVYPDSSSNTINQIAAGSAMLLAPYTGCTYKKATTTVWSASLSA